MTVFDLSSQLKEYITLGLFLLCIINIYEIVRLIILKRYLVTAGALVNYAVCYIFRQIFYFAQRSGYSDYTGVVVKLSQMSAYTAAVLTAVAAVNSIAIFIYIVYYSRNHITYQSIKQFVDNITDGFACCDENGAIVFINRKLNEIVYMCYGRYAYTEEDLVKLAENEFISTSDGRMYSKRVGPIEIKGQSLKEYIFTDITHLYEQTNILKGEYERLSEIKRELSYYNENIDEVIRKKEILDARSRIHDDMNNILLQSTYILNTDENPNDSDILDDWNRTISFFEENIDIASDNFKSDISSFAELIGISVRIENDELLNDLSEDKYSLILQAGKEAITNCIKHTDEKDISIVFSRDRGKTVMTAENHNREKRPAVLKGGLYNLKEKLSKFDGSLSIENEDMFRLIISI